MEFKTLKNIESSFRHLRLFSMLFLGACTLISVAAVWTCLLYTSPSPRD